MTEEHVTKTILQYLLDNGWNVVAFDFPQSGTGKLLHHNDSINEKNKNSIIPDIVAVHEDICVFFENKDRFVYADYVKIANIKETNSYSISLRKLLSGYTISYIYYGIGLPSSRYSSKAMESSELVDFVLGVKDDSSIEVLMDSKSIFYY